MIAYRPVARQWRLAHGCELTLGPKASIMGILNVTPDSFSDGGRFSGSVAAAAQAARAMIEEGADIVDVGGESTRPNAEPVSDAEERSRVLPVIEAMAGTGCLLSVDSYRAETARLAVAAGAHIINDVWGAQKEPAVARIAAETGAGLCLMHTGRGRQKLPDVIEDQRVFLSRSIEIALGAGVNEAQIVLDPGFGFAKDTGENIQLMLRFAELRALGFPLLAGTSRKRFVRAFSERAPHDVATAATSVMLRERGADVLRVHDVATNREALAITDALIAAGGDAP